MKREVRGQTAGIIPCAEGEKGGSVNYTTCPTPLAKGKVVPQDTPYLRAQGIPSPCPQLVGLGFCYVCPLLRIIQLVLGLAILGQVSVCLLLLGAQAGWVTLW